jgi:hypothetical protein
LDSSSDEEVKERSEKRRRTEKSEKKAKSKNKKDKAQDRTKAGSRRQDSTKETDSATTPSASTKKRAKRKEADDADDISEVGSHDSDDAIASKDHKGKAKTKETQVDGKTQSAPSSSDANLDGSSSVKSEDDAKESLGKHDTSRADAKSELKTTSTASTVEENDDNASSVVSSGKIDNSTRQLDGEDKIKPSVTSDLDNKIDEKGNAKADSEAVVKPDPEDKHSEDNQKHAGREGDSADAAKASVGARKSGDQATGDTMKAKSHKSKEKKSDKKVTFQSDSRESVSYEEEPLGRLSQKDKARKDAKYGYLKKESSDHSRLPAKKSKERPDRLEDTDSEDEDAGIRGRKIAKLKGSRVEALGKGKKPPPTDRRSVRPVPKGRKRRLSDSSDDDYESDEDYQHSSKKQKLNRRKFGGGSGRDMDRGLQKRRSDPPSMYAEQSIDLGKIPRKSQSSSSEASDALAGPVSIMTEKIPRKKQMPDDTGNML